MNWKIFFTIFTTVFLAELGDKTQLATMLFASDRQTSKLVVFLASALALVFASALGVLAGDLVSRFVNPRYLTLVAGLGFMIIGGVTLWKAW